MRIATDEKNNLENRRAFMSIDARRDIYAVWKKADLPGSGANVFRHYVTEAYNTAQSSGAFILFDSRGATEPEIINFINSHTQRLWQASRIGVSRKSSERPPLMITATASWDMSPAFWQLEWTVFLPPMK